MIIPRPETLTEWFWLAVGGLSGIFLTVAVFAGKFWYARIKWRLGRGPKCGKLFARQWHPARLKACFTRS